MVINNNFFCCTGLHFLQGDFVRELILDELAKVSLLFKFSLFKFETPILVDMVVLLHDMISSSETWSLEHGFNQRSI